MTPYQVIPVVAGDCWLEPMPSVGEASSIEEAASLVAESGYSLIPDGDGGLWELVRHDDVEPYWSITVHPIIEPR